MNAMPEQLAAVAQANIKAMQTLMQTAYATATRLATLNADTARAALEGGLADANALLAAKDAQGVAGAVLAQPAIEKTVAYWRGVYQIWADAQNELVGMIRTESAALGKSMGGSHAGSGVAPTGVNMMLEAVNMAMSAANTAVEKMSKATEQFAGMAQANVAAASEAASKAMTGAAKATTPPAKGA